MAKRRIEIFSEIHDEFEFRRALKHNAHQLICAEIYCYFAGWCTALDYLFNQMKLDWGEGHVVLLKVPADEIEDLKRFRGHSEPVFMFIVNRKVTRVFRGVHNLKFAEVAKRELHLYKMEMAGEVVERHLYAINQPTPEEKEWLLKLSIERNQEAVNLSIKRDKRQVARKRHRAELMVPYLPELNFVLFWPHCFHAHPELYERWNANNIIMVGREEVVFTEESAKDILYAGDAPMNEASMHKLLSGPALVICFRLLDEGIHFVSLIRKILYNELPVYDESKPHDGQMPRMTAYDYYKMYSPTRDEILRKRQEDKIKKKEELKNKRARRLSEMRRLAQQAITEELEARRLHREQKKLELLKSGNLTALKEFENEPLDENVDIVVPEELPQDVLPEQESEEEDENEYFPPPGLLVPGFYSPPNDIAKVNGLALLFPKLVNDLVTPQSEFLPPHVVAILEIAKRYKAIDALKKYTKHVLHMGIFQCSTPYDAVHLAYSVKQYDTLDISANQDNVNIVFMVSMEVDWPLLQLMELCPLHVSRDLIHGEDEAAAMFPVNYGDEYPEFEDFSISVCSQNDEMTC